MTRKTFKNFNEMSMSVTLKPKKNNMYKVTGVGSKMKAHGGIKKGEKFHDSEIDGMNDSGIKVKYAKPKKIGEAAFKVKNCGCGEDPCKTYGSKEEQMKSMEMKQNQGMEEAKIKSCGCGEDPCKTYGSKEEQMKKMNEYNTGVKEKGSFKVTVGKAKPIPGNPDYKGPQNPKLKVKLNKTPGNMKNEAIQRRMDRKTIIATDPATGRKVIKIAPKREVDIGKGRMESVDQMKVNELKISTMQKYKSAAKGDIQTGENARHKGYPEKAIDKQQDKRYKGIDTANKRIAKKQVKMAKGIAFDKRYKGGNMTGASKAINKIKSGLADHPKVSKALRTANEQLNQEGE
jgi:hypothetical protein